MGWWESRREEKWGVARLSPWEEKDRFCDLSPSPSPYTDKKNSTTWHTKTETTHILAQLTRKQCDSLSFPSHPLLFLFPDDVPAGHPFSFRGKSLVVWWMSRVCSIFSICLPFTPPIHSILLPWCQVFLFLYYLCSCSSSLSSTFLSSQQTDRQGDNIFRFTRQ